LIFGPDNANGAIAKKRWTSTTSRGTSSIEGWSISVGHYPERGSSRRTEQHPEGRDNAGPSATPVRSLALLCKKCHSSSIILNLFIDYKNWLDKQQLLVKRPS